MPASWSGCGGSCRSDIIGRQRLANRRGRFNPIHTMLATGTDAVEGRQDASRIRYADDMITMPLQCGSQRDALGHVFYGDKMWNGYDAILVDSTGANKNGIEKTRDRMVGRGVLLDIPRYLGGDYLEDGFGIGNAELEGCAKAQGVEIRRGDFVIVRTGQMESRLASGKWSGYAGGDAPGLRFEGGGLRPGRRLRVLLLRTAVADHQGVWLADRPDGDQIISTRN